jgi:hypothetical protein
LSLLGKKHSATIGLTQKEKAMSTLNQEHLDFIVNLVMKNVEEKITQESPNEIDAHFLFLNLKSAEGEEVAITGVGILEVPPLNESDKPSFYDAVRSIAKKQKADCVVHVIESWALISDEKKPDDLMAELKKYGSVSKCPSACSCLTVTIETFDFKVLVYTKINEPKKDSDQARSLGQMNKSIVCKDPDTVDLSGNRMESSFGDFLPNKKWSEESPSNTPSETHQPTFH